MIGRVVSSVLVVDDDPAFLALVVRMLEEIGVEVVLTAHDAASAMREAEARRPDAALVDVGLPDRDGTHLARQLAELPWGPRVIVTSTDRDAGRTTDLRLDDGSVAFIPKEDLVGETLRRLLQRD
jgi:CheY-like chemotaxis protein